MIQVYAIDRVKLLKDSEQYSSCINCSRLCCYTDTHHIQCRRKEKRKLLLVYLSAVHTMYGRRADPCQCERPFTVRTNLCSASYVRWQCDSACSCCWAPAVQQSIDRPISCLPGPQQETRSTLLQRSTLGHADRRTDTVPLHVPCHILYAISVKLLINSGVDRHGARAPWSLMPPFQDWLSPEKKEATVGRVIKST